MLEATVVLQLVIGERVEIGLIAALLIFNVALGDFRRAAQTPAWRCSVPDRSAARPPVLEQRRDDDAGAAADEKSEHERSDSHGYTSAVMRTAAGLGQLADVMLVARAVDVQLITRPQRRSRLPSSCCAAAKAASPSGTTMASGPSP